MRRWQWANNNDVRGKFHSRLRRGGWFEQSLDMESLNAWLNQCHFEFIQGKIEEANWIAISHIFKLHKRSGFSQWKCQCLLGSAGDRPNEFRLMHFPPLHTLTSVLFVQISVWLSAHHGRRKVPRKNDKCNYQTCNSCYLFLRSCSGLLFLWSRVGNLHFKILKG